MDPTRQKRIQLDGEDFGHAAAVDHPGCHQQERGPQPLPQQRKTIKYNHLVANCLIFHNLCSLTRLVQDLEQRGETVPEDAIAAISPYLTEHINRFGDYTLNLARKPPQPDYGYTLRRADSAA